MTSFQVLYGYATTHSSMGPYLPSSHPLITSVIQDRVTMPQLLKENLAKAQHIMKFYADKNKQEKTFEVRDQVYLKLQPLR